MKKIRKEGKRVLAALFGAAGSVMLLLPTLPASGAEQTTQPPNSAPALAVGHDLKIFNGEKRLFASYGPSTSVGYACIADRRIMGPDDAAHIDTARKFLRTHIHAILHDALPIPAWDQEEVDAVRKNLNTVPWQP